MDLSSKGCRLACHCLLAVVFATSATNSQESESVQLENELLVPLVINNISEIDYMLEQLEIVEYQKTELKNAINGARKKWLDLVFPDEENISLSAERKKELSNEIFLSCHDSLRSILTPDPYQHLGHILRQRKSARSARMDPALLPLTMISDDELNEKERANIANAMRKIKEKFETEKESLKKSCFKELTGGDSEAVDEIRRLALFVEELGRSSKHLDVSPKKLLGYSAGDFDQYEENILAQTTFAVLNNTRLRNELNIADSQVEDMMPDYLKSTNGYPKEDWIDRGYFKIIMMTPKDRNIEIKQELQEKNRKWKAFEKELADNLAEEHLFTNQRERIKQLAKSCRDSLESHYGDFFFFLFAWGKTHGSGVSDDFESKLKSVRKQYYVDISKLRESTWKSSVNAFPHDVSKKFEEQFGLEVYDSTFEVIYQWDVSRK